MPRVSVVVPVYNIKPHLEQCLDSIIAQSLRDIEIICVDDGSTDGSHHILHDYAQKDNRLSVATQINSGPGIARNTGLDVATGEFVIFLDSDDYFEAEFLEKMAAKLDDTGADVAICQAVEFDTTSGKKYPSEWMLKKEYLPGETFSPTEINKYLFQFTYGMAWDKMYRREWLVSTGIRYPALRNSEDLAFVFPTLLAARRITILPQIFIYHRVNRESSVSNTRREHPKDPYIAFRVVRDYLQEQGLMPLYRQSFMNWSMEFLTWHVCNISDFEIQSKYIDIIRNEWFPELGFEHYPLAYYRDKKQFLKYFLVRYAPKPIFRCVLNTYKRVKKRTVSRQNGDSLR